MLDCIKYPLELLPYSQVKHLEGKGNFAVSKYYLPPFRWFYRHKIRMIERALRGRYFNSIMDFGAGPGIMVPQWKKYAHDIYTVNEENLQLPNVNMTIAASVMEFVSLKQTFEKLSKYTNEIIIASPMKTDVSQFYFDLINDRRERNSHTAILDWMASYFSINYCKTWTGLYFCASGIRKYGE